ncbi:putative cytochrome P450 [Helianthus anomalus]
MNGSLMLLHLGSIPTLVVSSAEVAREIMKTHDFVFSDRPNLSIPNILFYDSTDIAFSRYGEYWRKLKSIVVLNLLSATRVKSFTQVREEEVGLVLGALGENSGWPLGMLENRYICSGSFVLFRIHGHILLWECAEN